MNGIYGWFGALPEPEPEPETADYVLDGMLAATVPVNPVPASDRMTSTFRSADLCAGVTGPAGSDLISRDGDIAVVLSEITPIGFHMIQSPRDVYRDVSKLLPAQVRVWRKGQSSARFCCHMSYQENDSAGFDDLRRQFRNLLPEVVGAAGTSGGRAVDDGLCATA